MSEEPRLLSDVLVELASMTAEPFDVSELVHLATERACQVLECDRALVLLSVDGSSLKVAGASDGFAAAEALFELPETPCHDALARGAAITFDFGTSPERYRAFGELAATAEVIAALSVPIRHRTQAIGALCVIRGRQVSFSEEQIEAAQRLADVVGSCIVREQAHRAALAVTAQLQHALEARVVVEQAKGMVAGDLQVSIDAALDHIRHFARRRQLRLTDVAEDIVLRRLPIDALRS